MRSVVLPGNTSLLKCLEENVESCHCPCSNTRPAVCWQMNHPATSIKNRGGCDGPSFRFSSIGYPGSGNLNQELARRCHRALVLRDGSLHNLGQ